MKNKKFISLVMVAVAAFFVYFGTSSLAEDQPKQTAISISPLTFELSANPGDTLTNEIIIRNSGNDPIVISVEAQDFMASGEEGAIALSESKTTYSLSSWLETESGQFTLRGGEQKKTKFIVRVPYNAEPGGHYASVYAHISPTLGNAASGAGVGQKIGSLVLLKVAGAVKEEAEIESFQASKSWYEKGPVNFDIRIKNTGTIHVKPKGMIAATDIWGNKVADIQVDQKNILPGATRHITAKWNKTPWFGKYTATILSYYGADNKQLTAATTFWIIPWKSLTVIGVIVLVILIILILGRKRLKEASKALLGKR